MLLQVELWKAKLVSGLVDRLTNLLQTFDHRSNGCTGMAITLVIKQPPFARSCHPQRFDKRGLVLSLKLQTAVFQTFKSISFGHRSEIHHCASACNQGRASGCR